jgi:hypothetical protein
MMKALTTDFRISVNIADHLHDRAKDRFQQDDQQQLAALTNLNVNRKPTVRVFIEVGFVMVIMTVVITVTKEIAQNQPRDQPKDLLEDQPRNLPEELLKVLRTTAHANQLPVMGINYAENGNRAILPVGVI